MSKLIKLTDRAAVNPMYVVSVTAVGPFKGGIHKDKSGVAVHLSTEATNDYNPTRILIIDKTLDEVLELLHPPVRSKVNDLRPRVY